MGLFSAVASIGSSLIGGGLSFLGAQSQNRAAQGAASDQMAFQERMFGSRYQQQMRDMRRAGLNPILSYGSPPPSAPTGASWDPVNVGAGIGEAVGEAVPQAIGAASAYQQYKNLKTQQDVLKSQSAKNYADANLKIQQTTTEGKRPDLLVAETSAASSAASASKAQAAVNRVNALIREEDLTVAQTSALVSAIDAELYKTSIGEFQRLLQRLGISASNAKTIVGLFKSSPGVKFVVTK